MVCVCDEATVAFPVATNAINGVWGSLAIGACSLRPLRETLLHNGSTKLDCGDALIRGVDLPRPLP